MERFLDQLDISISSGKGGTGKVSFEKVKVRGVADGGDGGRGGDVVINVDPRRVDLAHLKDKQEHLAKAGSSGGSNNKHGADGKDLQIDVPLGTIIFHGETGQQLVDCMEANKEVHRLKGGRGGRGNANFKSSRIRSPRFSQEGEDGASLVLRLEVRLPVDVALVGEANYGKSALLTALSHSTIPVAPYPYTTRVPARATMRNNFNHLQCLEIPALLPTKHKEHASPEAKHASPHFLRHLWRASIVLYLLDASELNLEQFTEQSAEQDYLLNQLWNQQKQVEENMADYQPPFSYFVLTKKDILNAEEQERIAAFFAGQNDDVKKKYFFTCCTDTMEQGVEELRNAIFSDVESLGS